MKFFTFLKILNIIALLLILVFSDAYAINKTKSKTKISKTHRIKHCNFSNSVHYAGIVMNADTGEILYTKNANEIRHPASLTKMMTLYLLFDALDKGRVHMYQRLHVSSLASQQPRTNLGLKAGESISVHDAIYALIIKSANDVAYVISEAIAGNSSKFVTMMNNKARQLGMKNTIFVNPDGWHNDGQITTAHDMARLAVSLRSHHQRYYHMFSHCHFKFRGKIVHGHNSVIKRYNGADGIKTGFTNASGFNLVTSTKRPEGNLVAAVMGGPTANVRDNHMIELLEYSYKKIYSRQPRYTHNNIINEKTGAISKNTHMKHINKNKTRIKTKNNKMKNQCVFAVIDNNQNKKFISTKK